MITTVEPAVETQTDDLSLSNSVNIVRADFAACRVKFRWFGTTKTLSSSQKSQAAESFGAEGKAISAAKRLIDTKNERYRALTSVKSQINRYWKDSSLAYPEAGIRLIKQDCIDEFNHVLRGYETELNEGVRLLDEHFSDLKRRRVLDWDRCLTPAIIRSRWQTSFLWNGISPTSPLPTIYGV